MIGGNARPPPEGRACQCALSEPDRTIPTDRQLWAKLGKSGWPPLSDWGDQASTAGLKCELKRGFGSLERQLTEHSRLPAALGNDPQHA